LQQYCNALQQPCACLQPPPDRTAFEPPRLAIVKVGTSRNRRFRGDEDSDRLDDEISVTGNCYYCE